MIDVSEKLIFFIPARRGSKGLPFKNRKLFNSTVSSIPLKYKKNIIVSTDDEEIIRTCNETDLRYYERSEKLSDDTASVKDVLVNFKEQFKIADDVTIILLYLTYPERTWENIKLTYLDFQNRNLKSLLCKKDIKTNPYLCLYEHGNHGKQVIEHDLYRRQDYKPIFELSHFIGIFKAGELENLNKNLYNEDTFFFKIENVIDIDTNKDLNEYLKKKHTTHSRQVISQNSHNSRNIVEKTQITQIEQHNENTPIYIFYHIGAIDMDYQTIVDDQIELLKRSGLYDKADKIYYSIVGNQKIKLPSKFKCAYKGANFTVGELPMIDFIRTKAKQENFKALYFHTKGSSSYYQGHKRENQESWRKYLEYFCIEKWKINLGLLETFDTVGASLILSNIRWYKNHYAGNFWWANSSHLKKLPPVNHIESEGRFKAEMWLLDKSAESFNWHKRDTQERYSNEYYDSINYRRDIAVFVHVYYEDMWNELHSQLKLIPYKFDLYVSITNNKDRTGLIKNIKLRYPSSHIKMIKNVGSDVGGFIELINDAFELKQSYKYLLKIHTKKGELSSTKTGSQMMKDNIFKSLFDSSENITKNIMLLNTNDIGMVGSEKLLRSKSGNDLKQGTEVNRKNMTILLKRLGIKNKDLSFFSGTMFWMRWDILEKYLGNKQLSIHNFNEPHASDGNMSHAMERVFACMVRDAGFKLKGV